MITPFLVLFSLMGIGYFSRKVNWLDEGMNEGLCNLLVHVAMPCLLLSSIIELEIKGRVLLEFGLMCALSAAFFFLYALLAVPCFKLFKVPGKYRGMVQLSMLSANNGFMGFPITIAFFGQKGLLLMVANNLAMSMVLWSYGVFVLKRTKAREEGIPVTVKRNRREVLEQVLNANVAAILLGILLGFSGLCSFIPEALRSLLSILGGLATPLSMIYIGATLYGSTLMKLFRDPLVLWTSMIRLTVFAALTFLVLYALPVPALMKQICLLTVTLPSAAIVPAMAGKFGSGKEEATNIVVLSTLFSLLSAPLGVSAGLRFF